MLRSLRRKLINDLRINRGQFLAVWSVVMLGVAFYGAMYPSATNMRASFYKTYDTLNFLHFQVQFDPTTDNMADRVRGISGVETVEQRLVVDTGLQPSPEAQYLITLRLISVPDDRDPEVSRPDLVEGTPIQADDEVLLVKSFADKHNYAVGDTLSVWIDGAEHPLKIAGLVANPEYLILARSPTMPFPSPSSFGAAWMRHTPLAAITGHPGEVNEVVIHLEGKSSDDNAALESQVRQALTESYAGIDNLSILARNETPSGSVIQAQINGNFPIMIFFSSVFLAGSVVVTGVLLGRVVQGEKRRIGTMRALGMTRRELVGHYLSFGLLIGITGGIVGTIAGYLNSFWVMAVYIKLIIGGTLPAFTNVPQWNFLLLGFGVAVVGSTLAGIYPAWKESATPPGIALRPAMPGNPGKLSRMVVLPFLPLTVRQALRNLLRSPGRSFSTALGVALGAMMIFSTYAMWDSFVPSVNDYYASSDFDIRVDLRRYPFPPLGDAIEQNIHAIEGVTGVQAALVGPVALANAKNEMLNAVAVAIDETDPFLHLRTLEGAPAFSNAEGVWIGNNTQRILNLHVGDILTIESLGQSHEFEVMGVVSYIIGTPVFVPRSLMTQFFPGGIFPATWAFVRTERDSLNDVRARLAALPDVVSLEVQEEFVADMRVYMAFFKVGTLIFAGFGYVLTFAVLFNTVNANLRERQDELAVLRALGSSTREIATIILLEILIMSVIGGVVGTPIGQKVGYYLQGSYDSTAFSSLKNTTLWSYLVSSASIIAIVIISAIPGLRTVRRADLGQVSKSQSL